MWLGFYGTASRSLGPSLPRNARPSYESWRLDCHEALCNHLASTQKQRFSSCIDFTFAQPSSYELLNAIQSGRTVLNARVAWNGFLVGSPAVRKTADKGFTILTPDTTHSISWSGAMGLALRSHWLSLHTPAFIRPPRRSTMIWLRLRRSVFFCGYSGFIAGSNTPPALQLTLARVHDKTIAVIGTGRSRVRGRLLAAQSQPSHRRAMLKC
jgi:hypothetical protein